jgi:hypothetical protein
MLGRGINIDHATLNRWAVKYAPIMTVTAKNNRKPRLFHGESMKRIVCPEYSTSKKCFNEPRVFQTDHFQLFEESSL